MLGLGRWLGSYCSGPKNSLLFCCKEFCMSRASHSKIMICSVELQWKGLLDWWLIGSQTYTSFKKPIESASEPIPFLYIYHCRVGLSIFYAESQCPGSGLVESRTQHVLCWVTELWSGLWREPDSVFLDWVIGLWRGWVGSQTQHSIHWVSVLCL